MLPVPAASIHCDCSAQPSLKRARTDFFPCVFVVLVTADARADIYSPGLIRITSVHEYVESEGATPQFLDLIACGNGIDPSTYCTWAIDSIIEFADGPIVNFENLVRNTAKLGYHQVSRCFSKLGHQQLLRRKILLGGASLELGQFVSQSVHVQAFTVKAALWKQIELGLRELVTSMSVLYHAGLSSVDLQEVPKPLSREPCEPTMGDGAGATGAANHANACSSDDELDADEQQEGASGGMYYGFDLMMNCIRLSFLLRSATDLHAAFVASLGILRASNAGDAAFSQSIGSMGADVRLPHARSVRRAWVRLDCLATLYERAESSSSARYFRSLLADSSQKAWNYFCVKEKRCQIPTLGGHASSTADRSAVAVLGDQCWDAAKLPTLVLPWQLSVLGHGAGNIVFKFRNLVHGMLLRTGNEAELMEYRLSVVGFTSDQGTEYKLSDVAFAREPNRDTLLQAAQSIYNFETFLQVGSGPQTHYLFPWALSMVGHLHLISNGLEAAVTKLRLWKGHMKHGLSALLTFLNSKPMRQRFQATCLPKSEWGYLQSFNKQLLDWRWESLGDLLEQLLPVLPILKKRWDLQKLRTGHHDSLSEIDAAVLGVCTKFLELDWLCAFMEMMRVVSVHTNDFMGWLEGCRCHSHIWTMKNKSWQAKHQLFVEETGLNACPCKGCRGSEMAAFASEQWLDSICCTSSDELTRLLNGCSNDKLIGILAIQQELRESLREEFQAKLLHWQHLPYSILGMLDRRRGKCIASKCLAEFEHCDRSKLHRVCHRFFSDDDVLCQIQSFASTDAPIEHYPRLHNLLVAYNSVSLVERSIEAEHAKIGKAAGHCFPRGA